MADWLRLRRQSHPPRALDQTDAIYSDASGNLKKIDEAGNVVDVGADDGSHPFRLHRVAITWETPALVPITLYTPTPGEVIDFSNSWFIVSEAFNGESPAINFTDSDIASSNGSAPLSTSDSTLFWGFRAASELGGVTSLNGPVRVDDSTVPMIGIIDDSSGGDPGSTAGAAEIVFVIATAP